MKNQPGILPPTDKFKVQRTLWRILGLSSMAESKFSLLNDSSASCFFTLALQVKVIWKIRISQSPTCVYCCSKRLTEVTVLHLFPVLIPSPWYLYFNPVYQLQEPEIFKFQSASESCNCAEMSRTSASAKEIRFCLNSWWRTNTVLYHMEMH